MSVRKIQIDGPNIPAIPLGRINRRGHQVTTHVFELNSLSNEFFVCLQNSKTIALMKFESIGLDSIRLDTTRCGSARLGSTIIRGHLRLLFWEKIGRKEIFLSQTTQSLDDTRQTISEDRRNRTSSQNQLPKWPSNK